MDFISPEVKQQLQQNQVNRQIEINASKMQFDSRAEQVAYYLYEEIRDYQNNLPDTEDVAMSIVQFNQSITNFCQRNRLHWLQLGLFPRRGHIWQTAGTDTACTTVEFSFNGCPETKA